MAKITRNKFKPYLPKNLDIWNYLTSTLKQFKLFTAHIGIEVLSHVIPILVNMKKTSQKYHTPHHKQEITTFESKHFDKIIKHSSTMVFFVFYKYICKSIQV